MSKKVLWIVISVFFLSITIFSAKAELNCDFEKNQNYDLINEKFTWICYNQNAITEFKCISYVKYGDALIQLNPRFDLIKEYGIKDYFESDNKVVNIYFDKKDLNIDINFTYGVICADNTTYYTYETGIKNTYKRPYEFTQTVLYLKENVGYIYSLLAFIIIIIIVISLFWRRN